MLTSKPGYSLSKHIGNTLKSRSAAIQTVLLKYNDAAANLQPPRSPLSWEDVVEYAFLADFNLLCDTREDICKRPWATLTARLAIDSYFKLLHAEEEMQQLNIEIPRLVTYIRDENNYLDHMASYHPTSSRLPDTHEAYRNRPFRCPTHEDTQLDHQFEGVHWRHALWYSHP
jgi:hypothetical protein